MRKFKLELEALAVDTFETQPAQRRLDGTVEAYATGQIDSCYDPSCRATLCDECHGTGGHLTAGITCPATCAATCPATCAATCPATCAATCPNTCVAGCGLNPTEADTCGMSCNDTCPRPCHV